MNYKTVFDAAQHGYSSWWMPAIGLIFVAVGLVLVLAPRFSHTLLPAGLQGTARTIFSWFFLIFGVLVTLMMFSLTYVPYRNTKAKMAAGDYTVIEGTVTDFVPRPNHGSWPETFTVNGKQFSYADYIDNGGFNTTTLRGGPVRNGLHVRIAYSGDVILRLEIAE